MKKALKKLGIILLALIVVLLGVAFLLPKEYSVEVTKNIDAPKHALFTTVQDLSNNPAWNSWAQMDTTMVTSVSDNPVGKGASFSWKSKRSGSGNMTFTDEVYGEKLDYAMNFGNFPPASGEWRFAKAKKGTDVTWTFNGSSKWPMNLMNFMGKSALKKAFDQGLNGLSRHMQNEMDASLQKFKVETVDYPHSSFLMVKGRVPMSNIGNFYQDNLRPLFTYLLSNKTTPAGSPCALIFDWDPVNAVTEMAAAIPLEESIQVESQKIENYNLPYQKALVTDYYGDYKDSESAHEAISYYAYRNGLETVLPVIEEYVTDQSEFPEQPEKWLTKIYYFIK